MFADGYKVGNLSVFSNIQDGPEDNPVCCAVKIIRGERDLINTGVIRHHRANNRPLRRVVVRHYPLCLSVVNFIHWLVFHIRS